MHRRPSLYRELPLVFLFSLSLSAFAASSQPSTLESIKRKIYLKNRK